MDSSLNMNTLASSLPTSNLANAEAELMDNFKAAALSITTLYRSSLNTSKQAYNAGYAAACTDLLSVIQQGVSLGGAGEEGGEGGMTIGRVMDWVEARLEAIRTREEEEDEEREGGGGAKSKARGGAAVRRDKRDTTPPMPSTSHTQRRASSPSTQRRQSPSTPSAPIPAPTTTSATTTTPHPAPSTADAARPPLLAPVSQATLTPPTHPRPLLRSKTRSQKELNHHLIHTATVDPFTFTAPGPTAPLFADLFPAHGLSSSTAIASGGKLVEVGGGNGGGGNAGSVTIGAKRRHAAMLDSSPVSSADGTPTRGDAYTVFSPSGLGLGNGNGGSSRKRTKSGRGMGGSAHHTSNNANANANANPSGYGLGNGAATMTHNVSGYSVTDTSANNSPNVLQPNNGNALAGDAMDVEDEGSGRERERKRVSRR